MTDVGLLSPGAHRGAAATDDTAVLQALLDAEAAWVPRPGRPPGPRTTTPRTWPGAPRAAATRSSRCWPTTAAGWGSSTRTRCASSTAG